MAAVATPLQGLNAVYQNWIQVLIQLDVARANPSQASYDAFVLAADRTGLVVGSPDYQLDGEMYNWDKLRATIVTNMLALQRAIQDASGPFQLSTRACP